MTDTTLPADALRDPPGTSTAVERGWRFGVFGSIYDDLNDVQTNLGPLPSNATVEVAFDSSREEPSVRLLVTVVDELPRVHITGVLSDGLGEADEAFQRLVQVRPLQWWKKRALVLLVQLADGAADPAVAQARVQSAVSVPTTRRRNLITSNLLREVAEVYRDAVSSGQPTNAVARHFQTSRPTAGRWVMRAREDGYLEPATSTSDTPKETDR